MKYYELINNQIHISDTEVPHWDECYDLIVTGLGSAGTFCALSAAREGIRVLGIERGACCGGMGVQGAVTGYYIGYPGGSFEKIDTDVAKTIGSVYSRFYNHPDSRKIRMEQALLEQGVTLRYHTVVLGVYAEEQQVYGIRILNDGDIQNIRCCFLTDSTSDGHVLRMLNVEKHIGRPTDGSTQPFSSVRVFRKPDGSITRTNDDSGYITPFDDGSFSNSVIKAHGKHAAETDPARERFLYVAPQIGVREGMTITGESMVNMLDIIDETEWPDTLLCAFCDIDRHGADRAWDGKIYQDWYVISNMSTLAFKIRIPLSALVPKGWKRLLAVSRCFSADNYASAALRMNKDMYRMGEAAGVALAQAIKAGVSDVRELPYEPLHRRVQELGCYDPRPDDLRGWVGKGYNGSSPYDPACWLTEWDDIAAGLHSDCPGIAIWSCRKLGADAVSDQLSELLTTPARHTAAIALGLLEDPRSIPVLREMVRGRSEYHFQDCRRSNQMPSVIAICLLGRWGDTEIVPELYEILKPEEFNKPMYHVYLKPDYKLSIVRGLNSVYYQHYSFTVAALSAIAGKHPSLKAEIGAKLHEAVDDGAYVARITDDPEGSSHDRIARYIREYVNHHF